MKKAVTLFGAVVLAAIIGALMLACGTDASHARFVPVTGITAVPGAAAAGTALPLTGTVQPYNATNQTIAWSVYNAGTTGAEITGNTLTSAAPGTVTVRAAIVNGSADGTAFTQDFNIAVTPCTHNFVGGICTECHMIKAAAIPAGTLTRGGHTITLGAFNMMVFEVTQELFYAVMGFNPSHFTPELNRPPASGDVQGRRPVEFLTWLDAVYFANLLSEREGLTPVYTIEDITREDNEAGRGNRITEATVTANWSANGFRLPTEAEWEYANRAGSPSEWNWHFGSDASELGNYAWYGVSVANGGMTREVGQKQPNAWGLYDTHGNVWEWVWDWHTTTFPNPADLDNPRGPDAGIIRVRRGGSFNSIAVGTYSAIRDDGTPDGRHFILGFRLVRP